MKNLISILCFMMTVVANGGNLFHEFKKIDPDKPIICAANPDALFDGQSVVREGDNGDELIKQGPEGTCVTDSLVNSNVLHGRNIGQSTQDLKDGIVACMKKQGFDPGGGIHINGPEREALENCKRVSLPTTSSGHYQNICFEHVRMDLGQLCKRIGIVGENSASEPVVVAFDGDWNGNGKYSGHAMTLAGCRKTSFGYSLGVRNPWHPDKLEVIRMEKLPYSNVTEYKGVYHSRFRKPHSVYFLWSIIEVPCTTDQ